MVLTFTRSICDRNIQLYTNILEKLVPLFFALDSIHYVRWCSIHIRDLKNLPESIQQKLEGLWTVTRSDHNFSSIAIDQAHEQTNKQLKGDGGAIGLFHDCQSLTQFLIVMPELARILSFA